MAGKPIAKRYAPGDERVATFRIPHGKLTAFQAECERRGTSLSAALIGFIDSVIDGGEFPQNEDKTIVNILERLDILEKKF